MSKHAQVSQCIPRDSLLLKLDTANQAHGGQIFGMLGQRCFRSLQYWTVMLGKVACELLSLDPSCARALPSLPQQSLHPAFKDCQLECATHLFLCRTDDAEEKCSTLGGSKTPVSLASSGEVIQRVPGVGLVFSDSVSEVPPVFTHMLENLPAIYETVIFVTVRSAISPIYVLCPDSDCRRKPFGARLSRSASVKEGRSHMCLLSACAA